MDKPPICIYLDSSDYSRFADIGYRDNQAEEAILDFLKEKKAQGLIEIRFSAIHLFEFLKDPIQRTLALRKVQVVEELCGDLTFRYLLDVFDSERKALGSGVALRPLVTSNDGEWFPATPEHALDRDMLVRGLAEKFPALSRAQIEAFLPQIAERAKKQMSEMLPLANVYDSDLMDRFLSGRISGRDMAREIAKGAGKPRILIGHYLEGNAHAQAFFGNLAASERTLHEHLVRSREEINGHVQRLLACGKDIKEVRRQLRTRTWAFSSPYLGLDKLPANVREAVGQDRYLEELPAISTHCNIVTAYFRDILSPSAVMPEIKESDAADILHVAYLPYVDLYRTDGRFSSLVEKLPKPHPVKVVSKLRHLPEALEEQLAHRAM
jgi:hypothetical protein